MTSPKGETIIDFGQVIAGRIRMKINAPAGTEIIFDHTEVLDKEGNFFFKYIGGCGQ
jgi:alpha-L-rhamnosidase